MKRIGYILTAMMLITFSWSGSLHAQSYVGFSLSGDVPLTFDELESTQMKVFFGGDIGFVYEWHKNHFFLQTGLHYSMECPELRVDSQHIEQDMIDTEGVPFIYRGVLDRRTDRIIAGQVAIPFYVGTEWKGFYVMAGVKAVLNVFSRSSQRAQLQTAGDYMDRYYEWFEDMPNHGYHDYQPVKTDKAIALPLFEVRVGGELGYSFKLRARRSSVPPFMRIGAFAEYGLLEMTRKDGTAPRTLPDYSRYMNVDMTHVYASREGVSAKPHLFVCGVRLTFLFPTGSDEFKGYPEHKKFKSNKHGKCMCDQ